MKTRNAFKQGSGSVTTTPLALTAFGVTLNDLQLARGADITVKSQAAHVNYHRGAVGTEPGAYVAANETFSIEGRENVLNTRIRSDTGTATINVVLWY